MMTAKDSFLAKLDQEKRASEASGPELQKEWLAALKQLYEQFRGWLRAPESRGLLTVEDSEIQTQNPFAKRKGLASTFKIPALKVITPSGEAIQIIPKARMVVGATGRVDFESGSKKTMLVRKEPGHWQFARMVPGEGGWQFSDLSEESFFAALEELLS